MVGSGTRKARAIARVERPPSEGRVKATRASAASAGWQQAKTSASRSSGIELSSSSVSGGARDSSCSSSLVLRASVCSRRMRSTARLRAVVRIHAPGLRGGASAQCSSAAVKASWTASSARARSPVARASTATERPHSSRKTSASSVNARSPLDERPDLHRRLGRDWHAGGEVDRLVQIGALDEEEAADLLFRLGERAVRDDGLAVADLHAPGGLRLIELEAVDPLALGLHLPEELVPLRHLGLARGALLVFGHVFPGRDLVGVVGEQEQVLHATASSRSSTCSGRTSIVPCCAAGIFAASATASSSESQSST